VSRSPQEFLAHRAPIITIASIVVSIASIVVTLLGIVSDLWSVNSWLAPWLLGGLYIWALLMIGYLLMSRAPSRIEITGNATVRWQEKRRQWLSRSWRFSRSQRMWAIGGLVLMLFFAIPVVRLVFSPPPIVVETVSAGAGPGAVAVTSDALWVTSLESGTLSRISLETFELTDVIAVGEKPFEVASGFGVIWVANVLDGTVSRVDPITREVTDTIPIGLSALTEEEREEFEIIIISEVPSSANGLSIGADSVWVPSLVDRTVWRIDEETRKTVDVAFAGVGPSSVAYAHGAVWVANSGEDSVSRIEVGSMLESDRIRVGRSPAEIVWSSFDGGIWVANAGDNTVSRISPAAREVTDTLEVGVGPNAIAAGGAAIWVTNLGDGTVSRIDVVDRKVTHTIDVGNQPVNVVVASGAVWVVNSGDGTLSVIDLDQF